MSVASTFGTSVSFYSLPGNDLVKCPDCGHNADALFGDHGGTCLDDITTVNPHSAYGVIRRYAREHPGAEFSINNIRAALRQMGIKHSATHFTKAEREGLIEHVGYEPSTDEGTKRHDVKVYRSTFATADEIARARALGVAS